MVIEEKYIVLKYVDIEKALDNTDISVLASILRKVDKFREQEGKGEFKSVVIEHDWPEYKPIIELLSARVDLESTRDASMKPTYSVPYGEDDTNKGRMLTYKITIIQDLLALSFKLNLDELQGLYDKVAALALQDKYLEILGLVESYINN